MARKTTAEIVSDLLQPIVEQLTRIEERLNALDTLHTPVQPADPVTVDQPQEQPDPAPAVPAETVQPAPAAQTAQFEIVEGGPNQFAVKFANDQWMPDPNDATKAFVTTTAEHATQMAEWHLANTQAPPETPSATHEAIPVQHEGSEVWSVATKANGQAGWIVGDDGIPIEYDNQGAARAAADHWLQMQFNATPGA